MNVVPGSAFFRAVPGTAGQTNGSRPAQAQTSTQASAQTPAKNAALHAQTADAGRRVDGAANHVETAPNPAPNPYGPRGSIIDIIA